MNNEMTLDKAVKLSDEELDGIAGGSVIEYNYRTPSNFYLQSSKAQSDLNTHYRTSEKGRVFVRRRAGVGIPDGKGDA